MTGGSIHSNVLEITKYRVFRILRTPIFVIVSRVGSCPRRPLLFLLQDQSLYQDVNVFDKNYGWTDDGTEQECSR